MKDYQIDCVQTETIKEAVKMAIFYCQEKIPTADSWSKQSLTNLLDDFENLSGKLARQNVIIAKYVE